MKVKLLIILISVELFIVGWQIGKEMGWEKGYKEGLKEPNEARPIGICTWYEGA